MRTPRVRFTIRRLMVAVAVAVVMLFGAALMRRRAESLRRAAYHADRGWTFRDAIRIRVDGEVMAEEYHRRLRVKYERAARPWLPVAPDPPPPE